MHLPDIEETSQTTIKREAFTPPLRDDLNWTENEPLPPHFGNEVQHQDYEHQFRLTSTSPPPQYQPSEFGKDIYLKHQMSV